MCCGASADANVRNGATTSSAAARATGRITLALLKDAVEASTRTRSPGGLRPVSDRGSLLASCASQLAARYSGLASRSLRLAAGDSRLVLNRASSGGRTLTKAL